MTNPTPTPTPISTVAALPSIKVTLSKNQAAALIADNEQVNAVRQAAEERVRLLQAPSMRHVMAIVADAGHSGLPADFTYQLNQDLNGEFFITIVLKDKDKDKDQG